MKSVLWYWVRPDGIAYPFKLVKTETFHHETQVRTYETIGVMAMNDFGTLVEVRP